VKAIVLFTRDLRIHDHPALEAAARADAVVPLFVLDPGIFGRSPNRDRFLLESIAELDRSLTQHGANLVVREGDTVERVLKVAASSGATEVHVSADVSSTAVARERRLRAALAARGIALHAHPGAMVLEPGAVAPPGKSIYSVFTPYWKAWAAHPRRDPTPPPGRLHVPEGVEPGPRLDPSTVGPDSMDLPPGGESAARRAFEGYLATDVSRYDELRNDMAADGTTRLSPYLRFGCLSPLELVTTLEERPGTHELVRQVCWRDFAMQLLANRPDLAWTDYRDAPDDVPPVPAAADYLLETWALGRTGIPLVDAGMRQLRREGWMHNRARMIVASYLTRRLGVPWQRGAAHFMRWLVDGDPANNTFGWQWVAGTGTDPRRSRSFNPVRQAQRFDPEGTYVRRYVRELADVPAPWIFAPWKDPEVLRATGYPAPILEVPADVPGPGGPPFHAAPPAHPGQATLLDAR
jgi:deoxyribodipyrimidine photo-lyase